MSPVPSIKRPRLNDRSRGQVMVIFVAAILTFVGLCAVVQAGPLDRWNG